ncbi:MAG: oligopeptide:H+ symporter [Gammaproteobacteria bacterium]|nr:oligopeptide:H+ symporter [Gammaproteobacteria bacterium]
MNSTYRHPQGLWLLTMCYSLFMAAFGGIIASLVLYQTEQLHLNTDIAYSVFSAAMALLWILPVGGGYLAGKLGYAHAARLGLVIAFLGMLCFCINSIQATYVGLALFVVGNALTTPAIWCMVDFCYPKESVLREAGFTLFYLFFNVGGVVGIFLGGWLASVYGFSVEFALDSACLLAALLLILLCQKKIVPYQGRSIAPQVSWSANKILASLIGIAVISTLISIQLFKYTTANNVLMVVFIVAMVMVLFRKAYQQPKGMARNKLLAFIALALISITFWTLYSLEPSFLSVFVANNVDTRFLGINIPAASYFAFDGVFVILVGLVLSRVWFYLNMKGRNPSLSIKFALSLIIIGLGFAFIALATKLHGNASPLPAYIIVIGYAIFSTGELLVGPLGISMVGSLAPAGLEGLMMGFWQLCIGIGGVAAGYIAMAPNLPDKPMALSLTNPLYIHVFMYVGLGAAIIGLIVLLFVPMLARLMRELPPVVPQL